MPIQILAADDSATMRRALAITFAVGDFDLTEVLIDSTHHGRRRRARDVEHEDLIPKVACHVGVGPVD